MLELYQWQNPIAKFNRLVVRTFRGKTTVSLPASGASVEPIDDIGDVVDNEESDIDDDQQLLGAKVIGVYQLESMDTCMHCKKGKVVKKAQQKFGTCENCATVQMPKQTKLTAKLFLEGSDITTHVNVRAYQDMLQAITDKQKITCENLISAPPFDATYNEYHVLTGVTRS